MEKVVFTNGCFDLIHSGHLDLLEKARARGTKLIVGINSDESVKKIKGAPRPFTNQNERAEILKSLRFVDEVRIFNEATPENLIKEINPNVLVKGGDWKVNEIVGADFVLQNGGEVFSIPLKEGFSSTKIIQTIQKAEDKEIKPTEKEDGIVEKSLKQHLKVFNKVLESETDSIRECFEIIYQAVEKGHKVLIFGNGGSAADAQHLAAEFVGRYETERRGLPAIALTTDTSALTAISNDYGFERVFSRQVEALANKGDVLIGISTSGNSPNVIAAIMTGRQIGCQTIGMTGASGKKLASLCDACILVPAQRTARIQEVHSVISHIWCEMLDNKMFGNKN
jgi:D-sedoheptulose 7-phosphate isomerase